MKSALVALDWRTLLMLPPKRRFTPEELRRAAPEPLSASLKASALLNLALPLVVMLWAFGGDAHWLFSVLMLLFFVLLGAAGWAAWSNPSSRIARWSYWIIPALVMLVAGTLKDTIGHRAALMSLALTLVMGSLVVWFILVYRHQYVAMRLTELDERERAVEMARRLAAAQLEPHFLFNTLASLQHWVATRDERAAPLLEALTGYLRATLPMFARPTIALADEAEAVRRYLQVMQARLGTRLSWRIEVDAQLQALPLPPGLLLTLVENAVEHGIEPLIGGGEVMLRGRIDGAEAVIEVQDDGTGLAADAREGLGLANVRERLTLTQGPAARLTIEPAVPRGCRAELRLPLKP
jgi:LytS/YehU family sensor histidine kinase